jgi:sugar/nucleoside kinase (ribokinase family)
MRQREGNKFSKGWTTVRDLLCAGELNVDLVLSGFHSMPVQGREIMGEDYTLCLGSSSANCCCVAASLGLSALFYGKLGQDHFGQVAMEGLERYGVDTRLIRRDPGWRTGLTVCVSATGDRAMATCFGDTIDAFDALDVPLEEADARHIHMASYFFQPRVRARLPILYKRAKTMGMTTSLDAGWDEQGRWEEGLVEALSVTDFFFPNESEACAIAGTDNVQRAARYIAALGTNAVVKCGEKGTLLCTREGEVLEAPPYRTVVVETTGAGDSFNAGFLYAYLRGIPLDQCLRFGNAAGAVSVTRIGGTTACPTLAEVQRVMEQGTTEGL